jgi:uncharacterized protein DUF6232
MRTYYRGPDAVVTSELFLRGGESARSFTIRDLRNVRIHGSDADSFRPTAAHVAGGLAIIAVAAWPLGMAAPLYAIGLVALGIPTLAAATVFCWMRPLHWELRATYRGEDVALYASRDERVFNQVTRALRRALEDTGPPEPYARALAA